MFVFTFDRGLFKFSAKTPALDVLFQLPPRYGNNGLIPRRLLLGGLYPFAKHSANLI